MLRPTTTTNLRGGRSLKCSGLLTSRARPGGEQDEHELGISMNSMGALSQIALLPHHMPELCCVLSHREVVAERRSSIMATMLLAEQQMAEQQAVAAAAAAQQRISHGGGQADGISDTFRELAEFKFDLSALK